MSTNPTRICIPKILNVKVKKKLWIKLLYDFCYRNKNPYAKSV